MDNMGVGGGNSMENSGNFSAPEISMTPSGEVADFNEFLKQNEQLRPQMEMPAELAESQEANVGERASEMQSSNMPTPAPAPVPEKKEDGDEAREELTPIEVKRDFEVLPKPYVAAVNKIINRDKKDPHKLLAELDVARWDLMEKAYGRKRGDGLNGRV